MLKKVEYEQAMALLAGLPVRPRTETVPLEAALGRNLAEDIRATFPMPPFDKSPFDGYAFRAQDAPGTLRVCGESVTGCEELPPLTPGTAMRIFTGAPVPEGADAVVKQEETSPQGRAWARPSSARWPPRGSTQSRYIKSRRPCSSPRERSSPSRDSPGGATASTTAAITP